MQREEEFRALGAFSEVFTQEARDTALRLDSLPDKERLPLHGMTVAAGGRISLEGRKLPAFGDASETVIPARNADTVVLLRNAGAILFGRTNDSVQRGTNASSLVKHPFKPELSAGAGAAVAVATGVTHAGIASDHDGKLRLAASYCGIVGFRPTVGAVSSEGLFSLSPVCDQTGILAGSVEDVAEVFASLIPPESAAALTLPERWDNLDAASLRGLRFGLPEEGIPDGIADAVRDALVRAVAFLLSEEIDIGGTHIPHAPDAASANAILSELDAADAFLRYSEIETGDQSSIEAMLKGIARESGPAMRARIESGIEIINTGSAKAARDAAMTVREQLCTGIDRVFREFDIILLPASIGSARADERYDAATLYPVAPATLGGIPSIVIPVGTDENGLPIGLQLIANAFNESTLFRAAYFLHRGLNSWI